MFKWSLKVTTVGEEQKCWGFTHSVLYTPKNKTKQSKEEKKKKEKYIKKIDVVMGLGPMYPPKKKKRKEIKIMTFLDEAEKREFPH